MKNILNFDSTTLFPIEGVITFLAILVLLGGLCYFGWKMKGVIMYIGIITTIIGVFLIYMSIVDNTI